MAKKELAKRPTSSGVVAPIQKDLPAHMRGMAGMGVERMRPEDVEIPRIRLLQALSPEVQEGDGKPNTFWHTVADVSLGEILKVVICYVDQSFILWRPRNMGGGILARAADGIHWNPPEGTFEVTPDGYKKKVTWKLGSTVVKSGLAEWGTMDPSDPQSSPAATRMYNLVVMMPDFAPYSPAVVTLQRSAIKVARKLMGKLKISQAPSFGMYFSMAGVKDQNPQGQEFFNYRFTVTGLVDDAKEFEFYKAIYEGFRKEGLRIRDIEGLQVDEQPVGTPPEGKEKF